MKYLIPLIFASGLAAGNALAEDNEVDHTGNLMLSAEIGAITTSGNTAGTSVTGRFEILQDTLRWSNEYTGNGYFKEDRARVDGEETKQRSAERYQFAAKAGYKLLEEFEANGGWGTALWGVRTLLGKTNRAQGQRLRHDCIRRGYVHIERL